MSVKHSHHLLARRFTVLPTARRRLRWLSLVFAVLSLLAAPSHGEDLVELVSGAKVSGRVLSQDGQTVRVETIIGGRKFVRSYPLDRVAAITINGERKVLAGEAPSSAPPRPGASTSSASAGIGGIEALIEQAGRTAPDWFDSTPLNYPSSLDLSWPQKPEGPWNNQKNVGQYIWDVINPNPNKWREGVKLMHHLLALHKDHPEVQHRVMVALGRMYHHLLEDYARAAFWWRKARVESSVEEPALATYLAECYWRLGSKQMAEELLSKAPVTYPSIKLWADMGNLPKALQIAEAGARGGQEDVAYIYAGDACRVAGQYDRALQYYRKLLALPAEGNGKGRIERNQNRARANIEAIRLYELTDPQKVPDGKYTASSLGYEAQVHVEVSVQGGKIESVRVTQHREKQFYSAISDTTRKIVQKQGVKGVDATSGATITSEAILNATAKALSNASK